MGILHSYVTLDKMRAQKMLAVADTSDDANLMAKARAATAQFDSATSREPGFEPQIATWKFDYCRSNYLDFMGKDALTITAVTDYYGRTLNTNSYIPMGGNSSSVGPYYGVRIDPSKDYILQGFYVERSVSVTGVWGYHDEYGSAWVDSGDTVQDAGGISSSVTTITVSANSATTTNTYGLAPRFSVGHLIQIDTEWMRILAKPSTTTLTVLRAQNGTTAATHALNASIAVYHPPSDIVDAIARWGAWLFAQDSTSYGQVQFTPFGMKVPSGLPPDLSDIVNQYMNRRVA